MDELALLRHVAEICAALTFIQRSSGSSETPSRSACAAKLVAIVFGVSDPYAKKRVWTSKL
jgi:hypothetical protein